MLEESDPWSLGHSRCTAMVAGICRTLSSLQLLVSVV